MNIHKVNGFDGYKSLVHNHSSELLALRNYERKLSDQFKVDGDFKIKGFSWPVQKHSSFLVDGMYGTETELNFRERLVCEKSNLNNRTRAALHLFSLLLKPKEDELIYITEQLTPLYKWLKANHRNVIGSEYLTDMNTAQEEVLQNSHHPETINHQDLTDLSFGSNQINHVLSFDCLEHIPEYKAAISEVLRVLKPGGQFMFSVPFDVNNTETLKRASLLDSGEIVHYAEPEYHGDPISTQGILSYYTFGWQVLEELKDIGFSYAYGVIYWSTELGYIGGPQVMICAEK